MKPYITNYAARQCVRDVATFPEFIISEEILHRYIEALRQCAPTPTQQERRALRFGSVKDVMEKRDVIRLIEHEISRAEAHSKEHGR